MSGVRVVAGPYLGDVSALCLLPSFSSSSRLPKLLLAGTGPQVLLYELETGSLLLSVHVFDGVRVHGIRALPYYTPRGPEEEEEEEEEEAVNPTLLATLAVHGEGRVKLFELLHHGCCHGSLPPPRGKWELKLVHALPRFFHWVLDVRFLQAMEKNAGRKGATPTLLAVGISDNSVSILDLKSLSLMCHVECSERCLLYSMQLWGSTVGSLRVAAGTIFNKVLIWKLEGQSEGGQISAKTVERWGLDCPLVQSVVPMQELLGHEGSIHRLVWSEDGFHLASASDDRSARVWSFIPSDLLEEPGCFQAGPILYGHGGRLWDCIISNNLLITASEDCTCRLWTPQGEFMATVTGHTGRGVWRCVYDPHSALLITAGADASIKVQSLAKWAHLPPNFRESGEEANTDQRQNSPCAVDFHMSLARANWVTGGEYQPMYIDSNSEYVRCLHLTGPQTLYVATNQGHIHHVELPETGSEIWTTLTDKDCVGPIVCMDLLLVRVSPLTEDPNDGNFHADEVIAFGNGLGTVTVLGLVRRRGTQPQIEWHSTWLADHERQLLGVFFCKSFGRRFVFTTDPRGVLRVWVLKWQPNESLAEGQGLKRHAVLVAVCKSPLQARIVCLDGCSVQQDLGAKDLKIVQLLVCGDQRGNLVAFSFPNFLLKYEKQPATFMVGDDVLESATLLHSCAVFKGAHGISAVASISISSNPSKATDIISTGRDGCVCKFVLETGSQLICTGVENLTSITIVESLECCGGGNRRVAAGFIASDFVLWDLTHQSELMRVSCGGWRRPHSYVVGGAPEHQYCFAYLKDHVIHVKRNWSDLPAMLDADRHPKKILSTGLQVQFHGREIHSVHFISTVQLSLTPISWIATGAEDGTVRITRYDPKKTEQLDPSMVLGEHMGGSAVRALTLVLGAHEILGKHSSSVPQALEENPLLHNMHVNFKQKSSMHLEDLKSTQVLDVMKTVDGEPLLLVSVGAKEVLTCWQLEWQQNSKFNVNSEEDFTLNRRHHFEQSSKSLPLLNHLPTDVPSSEPTLIAKWLSSYTPSHACNPSLQHMATEMQSGRAGCTANLTYVEKRSQEERKKERVERKVLKKGIGDEDDLRFLAVTAFSTRVSGTESVTCFMVTASSNATLRLHAFNVTSKSWLEVAVLEYHAVPVLALQHLVVPLQSPHIPDWCSKAYLIISGATDGAIAIWDITDSVVTFSRQAISSSLLNLGTVQTPLRPKKGRGSQGGRRWQNSRHSQKPRNVKTDKDMFDGVLMVTSRDIKTSKIHNCNEEASDLQKSVCVEGEPICSIVDEGNTTESMETHKASVLQPIHIFARVHQSGVNCLSVSRVVAGEGLVFALASGGDDQALHVRKFRVIGDSKDVFAQGGAKQLRLEVGHLSQESIHCAHNSAVKGVWTDAHWVFSTGLDQRLRCWRMLSSPLPESGLVQSDSILHNSQLPQISQSCSLIEWTHCMTSVPETEALHVEPGKTRGHYRIAVVGRGLQVINFHDDSSTFETDSGLKRQSEGVIANILPHQSDQLNVKDARS